MRRIVLGLAVVGLLLGAVALSGQGPSSSPSDQPALKIISEDKNPWTHLKLNNNPEEFRFAVVSDRTGGHRPGIFSRAVEQINLLQPEFVLSVGDLIEGYSKDMDRVEKEWKEFQGFVNRLQMPFFYVVGNHDITNPAMEDLWKQKFGRRFYHFVYQNVLFLMLSSEDPPGSNSLSEDQVRYAAKALAENAKVRWTFLAIHKPIWTAPDLTKNRFAEIEKLLADRPYTVFAGHVHRYQKFVRQGRNYYQLATTGGGSRLRGPRYGEFDQIAWVTMKKDGPVIANILLDGVLPENLQMPQTDEPGFPVKRRPTHPVSGIVTLDGKAVPGAEVKFFVDDPDLPRPRQIADALAEEDGRYRLSTYGRYDGAPVGEYWVTVTLAGAVDLETGKVQENKLPAKYAKPDTSGLKVTVVAGFNTFDLALKSQ